MLANENIGSGLIDCLRQTFAVALKYDEATMAAPRLLAKGKDLVALRIRQVAQLHGVPIVQRPPLARALYGAVDVGQEIPPEYYRAVAEFGPATP